MKTNLAAALRVFLVLFAGCFSGCNGLRPHQINAGYYIENLPDSKTTVLIGTNNSQANAIHAAIGDADGAKAVMIVSQWMWANCEEAYHSEKPGGAGRATALRQMPSIITTN